MANFTQALNTDLNTKLTSAVYDANIAGWVQKIQTHVLNSAGILVPLQLNANGNLKTAVSEALPAGNNNIGDIDVASCALPTGAATSAKQDTLIAKDFATQVTLAAVLAQLSTTGLKKIIDPLPVGANVIGKTVPVDVDGDEKFTDANPASVQLTGSFATIRPMTGATKTATSVASEAFAGASRLVGRRGLWIKNENWAIRLHVDGISITAKTGVAVEPFGSVIFEFDPTVDVPVYVISEAGNIPYGVVEW